MTQTAIDAGHRTFSKASTPAPTNADRSMEVVTTTLCLASVVVYGSIFWVIARMVWLTVSWLGPLVM